MIQTCEQRETQRAQGRAPSHALWALLHVTQAVPCGRLFRFRIDFIVPVALQDFQKKKKNSRGDVVVTNGHQFFVDKWLAICASPSRPLLWVVGDVMSEAHQAWSRHQGQRG